MAGVVIFREASAAELAAGLPSHPKATIVSESGVTLIVQYAPREVEHGDLADRFETLDKPGRKPAILWAGESADTMTCELFLDEDVSWPVGRPRYYPEDHIALLVALAKSREALAVNLGPQEAGLWYITDLSWQSLLREHGTNRVTRATVQVTFTRATTVAAGPAAGGFREKHTTSGGAAVIVDGQTVPLPTRIIATDRDSLTGLAVRYYGDPAKTTLILDANPTLHASHRLEPGTVILIPAP